MNNKYELTSNNKEFFGRTLYQIKALKDIPSKNVSKGDLGGFIEKESNLSQDGNCWVFGNARVYGNALVYGNAKVSENALVNNNMVIKASKDLINITGLRHNLAISLTGINVGCKHYKDLKDFESRYKVEGKENGYEGLELKCLRMTIKNYLILLRGV